jgi:hypothetical protein
LHVSGSVVSAPLVEKTILFLIDFDTLVKNQWTGQVPVAHGCNPNYSGGRNQEDHGSKPALGK